MPLLVTRRLVGVVGAVVSGAVVAVTGSLSAETLPDGSIACTRYVRVVFGTSELSVLVVLSPGW